MREEKEETIKEEKLDLFDVPIKKGYGVDLDVSRRALEIGKAAEHLVCADLILSGHKAFLTDQGMAYDIVFDHVGRLFRVQVKSTLKAKPVPTRRIYTPGYKFGVRRCGHGAKRIIGNDEFDLLALVAIDIRTVAYIPINHKVFQYIVLRIPGAVPQKGGRIVTRRNIDQYPIDLALEELLRVSS
jgi:PD-(D/E)XK endonuclease